MKKRFKHNRHLAYLKATLKSVKNQYQSPVRGARNAIENQGVMRNCTIDIEGDDNTVEIASGAKLFNMRIYIRGNGHRLTVGANCQFNGGDFYFEDQGCTISIGAGTTVEHAHLAVTEPGRSITVGANCMFSTQIELRTGDSHSILDKATGKRINFAKNVVIEDRVWIGAKVIVLKGVTVGQGSIIGTASLVTSSVPPFCVAAGIPAKVVRENVDWDRKRIYDDGAA